MCLPTALAAPTQRRCQFHRDHNRLIGHRQLRAGSPGWGGGGKLGKGWIRTKLSHKSFLWCNFKLRLNSEVWTLPIEKYEFHPTQTLGRISNKRGNETKQKTSHFKFRMEHLIWQVFYVLATLFWSCITLNVLLKKENEAEIDWAAGRSWQSKIYLSPVSLIGASCRRSSFTILNRRSVLERRRIGQAGGSTPSNWDNREAIMATGEKSQGGDETTSIWPDRDQSKYCPKSDGAQSLNKQAVPPGVRLVRPAQTCQRSQQTLIADHRDTYDHWSQIRHGQDTETKMYEHKS